jgi:hypothetical protein
MSKYGRAKYGISKYGKYELEVPSGVDLSQTTKFRLRSMDSNKELSRPITNQSVEFSTGGPVSVRLKTENGSWVYQQSIYINGGPFKLRACAVSDKDIKSNWVESVVGTIKEGT